MDWIPTYPVPTARPLTFCLLSNAPRAPTPRQSPPPPCPAQRSRALACCYPVRMTPGGEGEPEAACTPSPASGKRICSRTGVNIESAFRLWFCCTVLKHNKVKEQAFDFRPPYSTLVSNLHTTCTAWFTRVDPREERRWQANGTVCRGLLTVVTLTRLGDPPSIIRTEGPVTAPTPVMHRTGPRTTLHPEP